MLFPTSPYEEERLQALLETGALNSKLDPTLNKLCEEVRSYFDVPICTITVIDRARQLIKVAWELDTVETLRDMAFCNYTILSDEVFLVEDTLADKRFRYNPFVTGAPISGPMPVPADLPEGHPARSALPARYEAPHLPAVTRPSFGFSPTGSFGRSPGKSWKRPTRGHQGPRQTRCCKRELGVVKAHARLKSRVPLASGSACARRWIDPGDKSSKSGCGAAGCATCSCSRSTGFSAVNSQ
jgi:hypothetical protein